MRSITMSRVLLSGALTLGALGAIGGFTPGVATVEAAPSVSRFAGTYVWGYFPSYPSPITISDGGRITGFVVGYGSISGRVSEDGSFSYTVTETGTNDGDTRRGPRHWKLTYPVAGEMELDLAGNIVGTTDTGGSFVWLGQ